jgi:hypothetical protein
MQIRRTLSYLVFPLVFIGALLSTCGEIETRHLSE